MNNLPAEVLRQIVAKYGRDICSDARRCEGLLNDLCGGYRREINVLVNAIDERIPLDLLAGANSMQPELLLTRLEKRLEEQQGLTAEAARWAVESWALALGAVTNSDVEERRRKQPNLLPDTKINEQPAPESKSTNQGVNPNRTRPAPPPKPQAPSSKVTLPSPSQSWVPQNTSPVSVPANNLPGQSAPGNAPRQPSSQVAVSRKGFGIFRGCLLIAFLLAAASVVLFLGVPYAIEVMRETQRERNNQPPRFPSR